MTFSFVSLKRENFDIRNYDDLNHFRKELTIDENVCLEKRNLVKFPIISCNIIKTI
jgi:hypothetical protein